MAARHGVTNLNKLLCPVALEEIIVWKCLQAGSLSDGQTAALRRIGMDEIMPVLGNMARDGCCRAIPELNPEAVRKFAGPPVAMIWRQLSRKVLCLW
jgi:hypothetical protein